MNAFMKLAWERAKETMNQNVGGPFGATITNEKGEAIAVASNSVLRDCDPTAHAEINAIREACRQLNTYDLSGCTLYTTAYPCPMCLSAIIWAKIKAVYYGCTAEDAEAIGFRDEAIYRYIEDNCQDENQLTLHAMDREECQQLFEEYQEKNKVIY